MVLRFINKFISFVMISGISYVLLIIIWGFAAPDSFKKNLRNPDGGSFLEKRLAEAKEIEDVDILFLGASTTYMGFDTEFFREAGYKSFNLGSGAQTPEQTQVLLKRYLDDLNPKIVVYELFPVMLEIDGVESSLDLITNDDIDLPLIKLVLETKPNLKLYNSLIFEGFKQFFSVDLSVYSNYKTSAREYIKGGFVRSPVKLNKKERIDEFTPRQWKGRKDQLEALNANLELLKSKSLSVLLVRAPITTYEYNSFTNNGLIDSIYSSKANFYNFQDRVKLSDRLDFLDHAHLNQNGVRKFNRELLKILEIIETLDNDVKSDDNISIGLMSE